MFYFISLCAYLNVMLVVELVGFSQSEHIYVFEKANLEPLNKKVSLINERSQTVMIKK